MNEAALTAFIEAVYALELDDHSWLSDVLQATVALAGTQHGYLGFFFDASQGEPLNVWNVCALDLQAQQPRLVERAVWSDVFDVNGLVADGVGCAVMIGADDEFTPRAVDRPSYERLAHHLATALRSRRRLGISKLPHARELASAGSEASAVAGRYFVAREDPARAVEALTAREREVVLHAALGRSNKQIGGALGISDSTVRVLIARAAGKMGVRSRSDLLLLPAFCAAPTKPDSGPH